MVDQPNRGQVEAHGMVNNVLRGDIVNNLKIRFKLTETGLKYYELDRILGISEPTRCRMLRNELPEDEQERICRLIDEYAKKGAGDHE